uniref:Col_cuticle_N domain-containing protein n=1 Tax=Meloidogyne hapla TaxID=6305 RepID=A0A1I8C202_MELHA
MLTSVVQHTKTIAIEVVSGSQLNFIAAVVALFGLCFLFLYYLLTSELGYFNKTIDRKFEREMETTRNQLISEMRSLFQAGNRVDGTGDNLQPISTKSPIDISRKNTAYDGTLPNAVISVKYGKCSALVENLEGIGLSIKWLSPSSTNFPHLTCRKRCLFC